MRYCLHIRLQRVLELTQAENARLSATGISAGIARWFGAMVSVHHVLAHAPATVLQVGTFGTVCIPAEYYRELVACRQCFEALKDEYGDISQFKHDHYSI